jgi:hypothetical protein
MMLLKICAGCYAPHLGAFGYFVNGVSTFGWSDGSSYNNGKVSTTGKCRLCG